MLHHDSYWNASGVPPAGVDAAQEPPAARAGDASAAAQAGLDAPIVPPWTSRYFTNPTCRGFPWY